MQWTRDMSYWVGMVVMCFYIILIIRQLFRYFSTAVQWNAENRRVRIGKRNVSHCRVVVFVFAAYFLSRLLILCFVTCFDIIVYSGTISGFFTSLPHRLCRWDANHYLGIIRNWYVTEGDARLHLVFFPLFPLIGRVLYWVGFSDFVAALIVSNGAFIGCGLAMFYLVDATYNRKTAYRSVLFLMFNPLSCFYSMPYTESLFLLMTLLAVLTARRKRFIWAILFGTFAANTRIVGITVAIPIFWEMLRSAWEKQAAHYGEAVRRNGVFLVTAIKCVLAVSPVLLGLGAYLYLNYSLHGNPFQFMIYQRENWSQQMGHPAYTIMYTLTNAISYRNPNYQLGTWIPQIVVILTVIALMAVRRKKQHPADAAYGLVYFWLSIMPTWLLSGARYASAMYSLYPLIATIGEKRSIFMAIFITEIFLLCYMSIMCLNIGYVL